MNTEEAIEIITNTIQVKGMTDEQDRALAMAQIALRKQIPEKTIRIDENGTFDGNWKMVCPLCGVALMRRVTNEEGSTPYYYNITKHCDCGQAIDWKSEVIKE